MFDPMQITAGPDYLPALARYKAPVANGIFDIAEISEGGFHQSVPLHGRFEGSVLIVIGEVSGSCWQTSTIVSKLVSVVRELAVDFSGPGALLAALNTRMAGHLDGETATCLAFFLEPDGRCTVASAGRPWPIVNGRKVKSKSGSPLGLLYKAEFPEKQLVLRDYADSANVQIQMPRQ